MGSHLPSMTALAKQDGYETISPDQMLANEIITLASIDYINELLKENPSKYRIRKFEEFFTGKWYELLTNLDGHFLMHLCKKTAEEYRKQGKTKFRRYEKEHLVYNEQRMVQGTRT